MKTTAILLAHLPKMLPQKKSYSSKKNSTVNKDADTYSPGSYKSKSELYITVLIGVLIYFYIPTHIVMTLIFEWLRKFPPHENSEEEEQEYISILQKYFFIVISFFDKTLCASLQDRSAGELLGMVRERLQLSKNDGSFFTDENSIHYSAIILKYIKYKEYPLSADEIAEFNRLGDILNYSQKRHFLIPCICGEDFCNIIVLIILLVLNYLWYVLITDSFLLAFIPFFKLAVFSYAVFLTPTYRVESVAKSWLARTFLVLLAGVGLVTVNALDGFADGEGATATVYRSQYSNRVVAVEEDYSGVWLIFGLKLVLAFMCLLALMTYGQLIALSYFFFRNYVIHK